MNNTDLKIFALKYILKHDDLLKEQKMSLGEFVKECNEHELLYLLASGELQKGITKEEVDKYIGSRDKLQEKIDQINTKFGEK